MGHPYRRYVSSVRTIYEKDVDWMSVQHNEMSLSQKNY